MAIICPLFSSSKGNCTYIGSANEGILIDVGRSARQIERALISNNIDVYSIKAIFITHEHIDHIQGLKVIASRYHIKVFASEGTMKSLVKKEVINGKFETEVMTEKGISVGGMFVKTFRTPHDSNESVGYVVYTSDGKKAVVATDIGYMTDAIRESINGADAVLIESNHDVGMLQNGSYPYYLKKRIMSNIGHLSNDACAKELPDFIRKGTKKFILAHLSQENNMPELALQTSICQLSSNNMTNGKDFQIIVAPVENFSGTNLLF